MFRKTMETAVRRLSVLQSQLGQRGAQTAAVQRDATAAVGSVWSDVPQAPPDAILGVTEAFKKDQDPKKLNLGVGAYRTEEGKPLVLNVVKKAEQALAGKGNKEYLAIGGDADFCKLSAQLAFGKDSSAIREGRVVTVQSLSGTGCLRVGAEFLAQFFPGPKVILASNPTWANHLKLFPKGGLEVQKYRYYKPSTRGLDYEGMLEDLKAAPEGAVVLLHCAAHNPTGVDPTQEQWGGILEVVQQRRLLPFFDSAYQGFASGDLERDAAPLRMFADAGLEMMVSQSYAKNMGLYGERVGALSLVLSDPSVKGKVETQLKSTIRPMYSSPPAHGVAIARHILADQGLYQEWKDELRGMASRIHTMRSKLHEALKEVGAPGGWDHIINQIGMFSFTGLTKPQVEHMTKNHHVYCTMDGRISMAGLSANRCHDLAVAMKDAMESA